MVLPAQGLEPAKLLSSSCSLEKVLQCSCSFYGVPAPYVRWWMKDDIVGVDSTPDSPQVESTFLGPWANTTISLAEMPEMGTRLLCEGMNERGSHVMSIVLMSIKSPLVTQTFISGFFQGLAYGAILTTLLFLCLIPFIVKRIRKKLARKIAVNKEEKDIGDRAYQGPNMALKPEEPEKPIITPSSESQRLVGTHCVCNLVKQNDGPMTLTSRKKRAELEPTKPVKTPLPSGEPVIPQNC
ncbi:SIGLEC family-like protein 1 [Pteronotus mesoamericanus]|uniref:SIGLEC family-like protein 1 n=1 Tax=Pteronotus mesoamericanus TaxID=1884717 RepID=UPI0023EC43EE|nr:SIGLEC family-like protein 1 [Pteronotus parnellii mesoamericanus]